MLTLLYAFNTVNSDPHVCQILDIIFIILLDKCKGVFRSENWQTMAVPYNIILSFNWYSKNTFRTD